MQLIWLVLFALIVLSNSVFAATSFNGLANSTAPVVQRDEHRILLVQKQTNQPVYQAPPPPKPAYQAPPPPKPVYQAPPAAPQKCVDAYGRPCLALQPAQPGPQWATPQQQLPPQPAKVPQVTNKQLPTTATVQQPKAMAGPTYTFAPTASGTVQVFQNGQLVTTSTPQFAAQQFGYKLPTTTATTPKPSPVTATSPAATTPKPTTVLSAKPTPITGTITPVNPTTITTGKLPVIGATTPPAKPISLPQSTPATVQAQPSLFSAVSGKAAQIEQSKLGSIVVDVGATAGSTFVPTYLSHAVDMADVAAGYQKGGKLGAWTVVVEKTAETAGGAAGSLMMPANPALGNAVGTAATRAFIDFGTTYVSPVLADGMLAGDRQFFGGHVFGQTPQTR
jgi:hypothetical protein